MAAINDLINQIENPELRERIAQEVDRMNKQKKFGLVFEEHLPECTPLYDVSVRKGSTVALRAGKVSDTFVVLKLENNKAWCLPKAGGETAAFDVDELVSVAEFGEPIYPYLKPIDTVCKAPDSELWHTLIEADNYHALQLLEYLYAGKVDCIYIDPPYNTGARDWKYNNDYVDSTDAYRHSKWLSMMQKRLKIAKKLLNPKDSVLIVTIDEKEYLHLGCLLEEMFPEAKMQMITSRINKKSSTRSGQFARCEEYIYILQFGNMIIQKSVNSMLDVTDNSNPNAKDAKKDTIWSSLLRRGADGSSRQESPKQFYPVWVSEKDKQIKKVGEPLSLYINRQDIENKPPIEGLRAVWPIRTDGSEGRWQLGFDTLTYYIEQGIAKLGEYNKKRDQWAILYLKQKQRKQFADGILISKGKDKDGAHLLDWDEGVELDKEPKTMWVRDWHDASEYGTNLLGKILIKRKFPFPKSLYAVEDTIRFFVENKPKAIVVDFFSGSGTTLHAVNLINARDNGQRQCIMVTNNEVSDHEASKLIMEGYRPGDEEWERLGIARYLTWPRTVCAIEGNDTNGNPLKGNYLGHNLALAEGFKANAAFFKLSFLNKTDVALGRQFKEMLPALWMKAGACGPCPRLVHEKTPAMLILPENRFAVLADESVFSAFEAEVNDAPEIETVYIITDYEAGYSAMAKNLNAPHIYQLYRDYLDNFRINVGRN